MSNIGIFKETVKNWLLDDYSYQVESKMHFADDDTEDLSDYLSQSNQNTWSLVTKLRTFSSSRANEYKEYDRMEKDVLISSALELYADDSTQPNDEGKIVWVESSDNPDLAEELNEVLTDFDVEDKIWNWAYELAKYGECYEELFPETEDDEGNKKGLSPYTETVEDPHKIFNLRAKGKTINYARLKNQTTSTANKNKNSFDLYTPYKFVHFCMTTTNRAEDLEVKIDDEEHSYKVKRGRSILENVITNYRILRLLENSMIASRLSQSAILRIFELEVGNKSPKKVKSMVARFKNLIGSQENLDIQDGLYETQNNPGPLINPVVVPTKSGMGSVNVQEYGGNTDVHSIVDVDYFRNKVFAGLKITKAFLGFEEALPGSMGSTTLTKLDVRYARSVKRVIKALSQGIRDLLNIYLLLNDREAEVNNFDVSITEPTTADELQKVDELSEKMRVVDSIVSMLDRYPDEEDVDMTGAIKFLIDRILKYPDLRKATFYDEQDDDKEEKEDNANENSKLTS